MTLDRLAGDWKIYQLKGGHRFSTDDLMTAWTACRARPSAASILDLGCGIGSVGLLTLWKVPSATLMGVEVQSLSLDLAVRTAAFNGVQPDFRLGDLRSFRVGARFDLITGSPPYIPASKGTASPHPQRAAARMELHGDVFDYCRAAAYHLAPDGAFCFCHAFADVRPLAAVEAAGLRVVARRDVHFRFSAPPLISLYTCAFSGERCDFPPFYIRGAEGRWTPEYLEMRAFMGTVVH